MAGQYLVVYYSRSGTTRMVAEALSEALDCDIDEISERKSREGFLGYLRSLVEAFEKRPSPNARWTRDPSTYDLVMVGTPVWAWTISSPVRAYLGENGRRLRKVAFFCTQEATGAESVFTQMGRIVGKAPDAVAAFTASDVIGGRIERQISDFVEAVIDASPPPPEPEPPDDMPPEPEHDL